MSLSPLPINIKWHLEEGQGFYNIDSPEFTDLPIPVPPNMGSARLSRINLELGFTLFKGDNNFLPVAKSREINCGLLEVNYNEPILLIGVLFGGNAVHQHEDGLPSIIFGHENICLYHIEYTRHFARLDGSSSSTYLAIVCTRTILSSLLGQEQSARLLEKLGIAEVHTCTTRNLRKDVLAPMREIMRQGWMAEARRLYIQTKILEFLNLLDEGIAVGRVPLASPSSTSIIEKVHARLMELEGKPPTLLELGKEYGMSAQSLNDAFAHQYGQTIYAFLMSNRLDQALEELKTSDIPMKALAAKLGYSHVNHFITAFKRRFGYPPGTLRR